MTTQENANANANANRDALLTDMRNHGLIVSQLNGSTYAVFGTRRTECCILQIIEHDTIALYYVDATHPATRFLGCNALADPDQRQGVRMDAVDHLM